MKNQLEIEEIELVKSIEEGEWKSVDNVDNEIQRYKKIAGNSNKKDKRINIRISSQVLDKIKLKAESEGIPYQTLISSILYKYSTMNT